MVSTAIDQNLGALQLGHAIALFLFGFVTVQVSGGQISEVILTGSVI